MYTITSSSALLIIKIIKELIIELTKKETEYNELYELTEDLKAQCRYYAEAYHSVKADTVKKMQEEIKKTLSVLCKGDVSEIHRMIDQIAKEMLEGT